MRHQSQKDLISYCFAIDPKFRNNWHLEELTRELMSAEDNSAIWKILIVMMPPRHGKSQTTSIYFPSWYLGKNPDKHIITASYSGDLATDFGSKTRGIVEDEAFKQIFELNLRQDDRAKGKWVTEKGGSYTSVGVGGAITGRGAHILLIDDPIKNREEAESQLIRNKHWDWFTSTAYTRLEPNGKVILILTRWHLDDLAGKILQNEELAKNCKVIKFPAIAEIDDKHRKKGEPLWPERYDLKDLESIKKTVGVYDWSSLYQQNPILTENQEFQNGWIQYRTNEEVKRIKTRNFLTVDTAVSQRDSADFCGFCDNSVDEQNFWNLKAWRMKINPKELIDYLFMIHSQRGYEKIGIEKTVYLMAIKPFLDEEMRKRGRWLPIYELEHKQTAKEIRIRALIPYYSSRSVFHIIGECRDLEEELFSFPMGVHDDVLDSTAYQVGFCEKAIPDDIDSVINNQANSKENIYNAI